MPIANVMMGATANERDENSRSAAFDSRRLFQGGSSMNMTNPGRGIVRRLGLAAAAIIALCNERAGNVGAGAE